MKQRFTKNFILLLTLSDNLIKQFTLVILLATFLALIPYLYTAVAALLLYIKFQDKFAGEKFSRLIIISSIAFVYTLWAMLGSGEKIFIYGMLLSFTSFPLYIWLKYKKRLATS